MAASLDVVYSTVLQNGIRKFKYKNSHLKPVSFSDQSGRGYFAYRSKHMIEGIGLVITSEEGVIENDNRFTHWTPNVFRYGTYADEARMFTKATRRTIYVKSIHSLLILTHWIQTLTMEKLSWPVTRLALCLQ